jgi:NifB/MoaA-like Fe-S oxidoreductase
MRPHTPEEAAATLDYIESLQAHYLTELGFRFVYPSDEWYLVTGRSVRPAEAYDEQELHENGLGMVRRFLVEWEEVKKEIGEWRLETKNQSLVPGLQSLTLVTGTLFAGTLAQAAAEFAELTGVETAVLPIINERLGATITAAGLLMGSDVLDQLQKASYSDLVVLPRVMFDHPDTIALDDLSPQDIANKIGRPVALADTMGDVWDALIGQSQVIYQPEGMSEEFIPLRLLNEDDLRNNQHLS